MNVQLAVAEGIAARIEELGRLRLKLIDDLTDVHRELAALHSMTDTAKAATRPTP